MEFKITDDRQEGVSSLNSSNLDNNEKYSSNKKKDRYERQARLAQMPNTFVPIMESSTNNSNNMSFIMPEDNSKSSTPTKKIPAKKNTMKPVSPFFHMSGVGTYTPPLHLLEQQQTVQSQKRSTSAPAVLKHKSRGKEKPEDLQFHLELGGGGRKSLFKKKRTKSLFKKKRTKKKRRKRGYGGNSPKRRGYGGKSPKRRKNKT